MPTEGVPVDLQTINTQINDYTINDTDTDNDIDDSEVVYNNRMETSSFLPHCNNDYLETNAIYRELRCPRINWPSIKNEPLNEYTTPFLATMAFPALSPDGKGDPTNLSTQRDISFSNGVHHLIKFSENIAGKWVHRFASHLRFSY